MIIKGTIESIEYRTQSGHEKKVATIVPNKNEKAFVQFSGIKMPLLDGFKEGDFIEVDVMLRGQLSKTTGIEYNNLIANELITRKS